jgi:hypothetical protein
MLTPNDVYDLAEKHNIRVLNFWTSNTTRGREVPQLREISLFLMERNSELWKLLMTTPSEVPLTVNGTRQSTGSGSTDNMLYPCYRELLPEVNAARKALGWDEVRN